MTKVYFKKTEDALNKAASTEQIAPDQLLKEWLMRANKYKSTPPPPTPPATFSWLKIIWPAVITILLVIGTFQLPPLTTTTHLEIQQSGSGTTQSTESKIKRRQRPKKRHETPESAFKPVILSSELAEKLVQHNIRNWEELKVLSKKALIERGLSPADVELITKKIQERPI